MSVDSPEVASDVTVNLEGMWLLQALLGIPTLAPELRAVPYGAARTDEWLDSHPGVDVLREEGLVDNGRHVVDVLAGRLAVLAVPDVEVAVLMSHGPMNWMPLDNLDDPSTWRAVRDEQLRVVLARRDGRWVSAVRAGTEITIDDVAGGGAEWLGQMVMGLLDGLHPCEPSRMAALNVPMEEIVDIATARAGSGADAPNRDAPLRALGVRGAALSELAAVIDEPLVEAVFYARAYVDTEIRHSVSALNLRDTDAGRLAMYRLAAMRGSAQAWMTIAPATIAQVEQGVRAVLSSVDVATWDTHRRM